MASIWQTFGETFGKVGPVLAIWRLVSSRTPPINFGSPIQVVSDKPELSWWHIPAWIRFRAPWHRETIERCSVHLLPYGQSNPELPANLRWRSRDESAGDSRITLEHGASPVLVPVVRRNETDPVAYITDDAWLVSRKPERPLEPGWYFWCLEVRSGGKKWPSPHVYMLTVPPKGSSNGHFIL